MAREKTDKSVGIANNEDRLRPGVQRPSCKPMSQLVSHVLQRLRAAAAASRHRLSQAGPRQWKPLLRSLAPYGVAGLLVALQRSGVAESLNLRFYDLTTALPLKGREEPLDIWELRGVTPGGAAEVPAQPVAGRG